MKKAIQLLSLALTVFAFTSLYAQDAAAPAANALGEEAPMGGEVTKKSTDAAPAADAAALPAEVKAAVEAAAPAADVAAPTMGAEIKDEAMKAVGEVKDEAMKAVEEAKTEVMGAVTEGAKEEAKGVIGWIKDKVMMVVHGIKDGFVYIWDSIMGMFGKKDAPAA